MQLPTTNQIYLNRKEENWKALHNWLKDNGYEHSAACEEDVICELAIKFSILALEVEQITNEYFKFNLDKNTRLLRERQPDYNW